MPAPLKRPLAVLALVVAIILAPATAAVASPALWVVKDEDSTIYLFGTVAVLRPDTPWRSPALDKALAASAELWIEVENDPVTMQALVEKYGFDRGHPLSKKLPPERLARLNAASGLAGLDPALLEQLRPWLAGLTVSAAPMAKAGYEGQHGVEVALAAEAKATGKPLRTLETSEQQILVLAGQSPAIELQFFDFALDETQSPATLDASVKAWLAGDVVGIQRLTVDPMKARYPDVHAAMIVKRNGAWADQIAALLEGEGVVFIAVTAAHLVGDDGVQSLLARRGITVERLPD